MAKRKRGGRRGETPTATSPYRAGLVVVHGVGDQKPGATVGHVTRRLVETLGELGLPAESADVAQEVGEPRAKSISIGGSRPVLIVEAHWSDIIRDQRDTSWGAAFRRLTFILGVFPYLFAAAIGPRFHEDEGALTPKKQPDRFGLRRLVDAQTDELLAFAPMMWRGLSAISLVTAVVLAATAFPLWTACIVAALVAGFLLLTRSGKDVIEHVRVAGAAGPELAPILDRVEAAIAYACARCDTVRVIGHSQGGYIAHRVLAAGERSEFGTVTHFTGVASGLRPISLIAALGSRGWVSSGWVWLSGAAVMSVAGVLALEPGGLLNTAGSRTFSQFVVLGMMRPDMLLHPDGWTVGVMQEVLANLVPTQWWWLPLMALSGGLIAVAARTQRRAGGSIPPVSPLPARITWDEVSSPSDLVGSMAVPELPDRTSVRALPSLRHPLADHVLTSYLGRRSVLRFELARWIVAPGKRRKRFAGLDACTRSLSLLAERTYVLRLATPLLFVATFIIVPLTMGVPVVKAVTLSALWGVGITAVVALIAFVWWGVSAGGSGPALRARSQPGDRRAMASPESAKSGSHSGSDAHGIPPRHRRVGLRSVRGHRRR